jgi:hypothetical protein
MKSELEEVFQMKNSFSGGDFLKTPAEIAF